MIYGAILFLISHVERVGEFYLLPANGILGHALHVDFHVLALESFKAEGHEVVNPFAGKPYVGQYADLGVAADYAHLCLGGVVLHGQEQQFLSLGNGHYVLLVG